ncbi:MAG: FAD-dependent oxidoreductase, partial [Pseudomonadota bacterium]
LLSNAGVDLFEGRATIVDAHTVRVNGQDITAKYILVATGGKPSRPTEPGQELGYVSDDLFYLEERPQRMLVAGGGYIAVEFAGIFNGLGSDVTQIYRGPMFLRGFDGDVRSFLAQEMQKKGINLLFNQIIEKTEKSSNGLVAHFTDGSQQEYDAIFYAIGRTPNVDGLGLENTNVKLNKKGAIIVDEYFQTTEPSIYALGDVIGRVQLTPVAIAEGMALAANLFKGAKQKVDYADIPTAVFSHPTIGTVGLTEEQAREQFGSVDVYYSDFRPMKHTMSGRNERSMMKLIVDQTSDRVLGAHMVGLDAPEIVQGLGIALKAGATKAQFDATIGIHPTAAEEFVTMRTKRPEPSAEQVAAAQ